MFPVINFRTIKNKTLLVSHCIALVAILAAVHVTGTFCSQGTFRAADGEISQLGESESSRYANLFAFFGGCS